MQDNVHITTNNNNTNNNNSNNNLISEEIAFHSNLHLIIIL